MMFRNYLVENSMFLCKPRTNAFLEKRYGSKMFKENYAKVRPLKTPTMIALDNFDFYYGPVFGQQWSSIRLGLLTPNKYFAVLNRFSKNWEENEKVLKDMGAVDVLEAVKQSGELQVIVPKEEQKATKSEENAMNFAVPEILDEDDTGLNSSYMRGEAGLQHFRQSRESNSLEESVRLRAQKKKVTSIRKIKVTGFEGQYVKLPKIDHTFAYPDKLAIYSFPKGDLSDYPQPPRDGAGTSGWWLLDGGSIAPVLALGLTEGENVLDMCAAPGGKNRLVCNDNKQSRLGQLHRALGQYIPASSDVADRVVLKRKDASILDNWDECNMYDKVLVDVPCTSDRLSVNRDDNNLYSTLMTEQRLNLPEVQTRMLINALRSVRVGGCVVYSTCALSPVQNEGVIENGVAIADEHFGIKVMELSLSQMEFHFKDFFRFSNKSRRGSLILPFLPSNCGPMYFCKLQRIQ